MPNQRLTVEKTHTLGLVRLENLSSKNRVLLHLRLYFMMLNSLTESLAIAGRWMAKILVGLMAVALLWQGAFVANLSAMAAPANPLVAAADLGSKAQGKASKDAGQTKGFIRDARNTVEKAASDNARKVDRATDDNSAIADKAKRDADRIQERAEKDASRTQDAVDNTKNAIENTIDNIKDAFGN